MPKIIVLMGAPGAGKGTQARLLQERLHLPQISTGDIFRSLKNAQTPLGEELRQIMTAGQLVPDEMTTRLVKERTSQPDTINGYILDGYPRTPTQANALEELAREQGNQIVRNSDRRAARTARKTNDWPAKLSHWRRDLQYPL